MNRQQFGFSTGGRSSFQGRNQTDRSSPRRLHQLVVAACAALLLGCQLPQGSGDDTARIARSLERRITDQEARHILLDDIDYAIQAAQAHGSDQTELNILAKHRQRSNSRLESFLARSRAGDELWVYRTYDTADRRGGESGLALVRNGQVVEHLGIMTRD